MNLFFAAVPIICRAGTNGPAKLQDENALGVWQGPFLCF